MAKRASRGKELSKLVNQNKKKLTKDRIEELSKLFTVTDGALVYELSEYLSMDEDTLFSAIQDAFDYDMQAIKHGDENPQVYIDKYNQLVEKDNRENQAIEELVKSKILGLKMFAPKNVASKLDDCTVYVLNHEIWIAINEKVKLITFFNDEHDLIEIHLYGYKCFDCREDLGHADTAMYIHTVRDEVFDETTKDAIKVWRSTVMEINKEIWNYKSIVVDNLLFFRNFGVIDRKFTKTNKHKTLNFLMKMNLQQPTVVRETINGVFFRQHLTPSMKLKNTHISYIHRLAEYLINFRYKILPEERKDN